MPNGYIKSDGDHYNYNLYKLVDHNNGEWYNKWAQLGRKQGTRQFTNDIFDTDKECIDYLLGQIIDRLRQEGHRQRKDNKIWEKRKKVWWNGK